MASYSEMRDWYEEDLAFIPDDPDEEDDSDILDEEYFSDEPPYIGRHRHESDNSDEPIGFAQFTTK